MSKKLISTCLIAMLSVIAVTGCGANTEGQANSNKQESGIKSDSDKDTAESSKEEATVIRIFSIYDSITETESSKFAVEEMEKALNVQLVRDRKSVV